MYNRRWERFSNVTVSYLNSFYYRTNSSMNVNEFFEYIKERFDDYFAAFLCKQLKMISPAILVALTVKEINVPG